MIQEYKEYNEKLVKWDNYFYQICKTVASNSSCLSRHIGAILVDDKSIISAGYNGPPRGIQDCDKRWHTDIDLCNKAGFDELLTPESDVFMDHLKGMCPRYAPELGFESGQGLEWCVAGHAERNALINAARNGIKTKGCKVYMDCGVPCTPCLVELINAGIEEIIITKMVYYDISAMYLLEQCDMKVRLYTHACEHERITPQIAKREKENFCPDCGMYMGV
jgi:dCMP deaminase